MVCVCVLCVSMSGETGEREEADARPRPGSLWTAAAPEELSGKAGQREREREEPAGTVTGQGTLLKLSIHSQEESTKNVRPSICAKR